MRNETARKEYFNWLCRFVSGKKKSKFGSYNKLLNNLHNTEFTWTIPMDANRAEDGKELRCRFVRERRLSLQNGLYLGDKNCSVLEMIVALAIRCEENVMRNPDVGDRTGQWFWSMIVNLGLGRMTDDRFDEAKTQAIISRFLARRYEPNGEGGLFTVRNCRFDLRTVEIWYQAMWRLDEESVE